MYTGTKASHYNSGKCNRKNGNVKYFISPFSPISWSLVNLIKILIQWCFLFWFALISSLSSLKQKGWFWESLAEGKSPVEQCGGDCPRSGCPFPWTPLWQASRSQEAHVLRSYAPSSIKHTCRFGPELPLFRWAATQSLLEKPWQNRTPWREAQRNPGHSAQAGCNLWFIPLTAI